MSRQGNTQRTVQSRNKSRLHVYIITFHRYKAYRWIRKIGDEGVVGSTETAGWRRRYIHRRSPRLFRWSRGKRRGIRCDIARRRGKGGKCTLLLVVLLGWDSVSLRWVDDARVRCRGSHEHGSRGRGRGRGGLRLRLGLGLW